MNMLNLWMQLTEEQREQIVDICWWAKDFFDNGNLLSEPRPRVRDIDWIDDLTNQKLKFLIYYVLGKAADGDLTTVLALRTLTLDSMNFSNELEYYKDQLEMNDEESAKEAEKLYFEALEAFKNYAKEDKLFTPSSSIPHTPVAIYYKNGVFSSEKDCLEKCDELNKKYSMSKS